MTALTKILIVAGALASAAPALAASERLTDTAYLQAVRCQALGEAGGADTSAITAMLRAQRGGRENYIGDRARAVSRDVARQANRANDDQKRRMAAELSGACAAYMSPSTALATRR